MLALGAGESALQALDDSRREACSKAWRLLNAMDEPARARKVAAWLAEAGRAVPAGLECLHPSWRQEVLADGRPEMRAAIESVEPGAGSVSGELRREIARLAFRRLSPLLVSSAGPLAQRLCGLGFEELLAEITRMGARTVGRSLAGAAKGLRARAMASAGEPWAGAIGAGASEDVSPDERAVAVACASTAVAGKAHAPAERLLAIGLAAMKAQLQAEHPCSTFRVAGRLPAPLGRALAGW